MRFVKRIQWEISQSKWGSNGLAGQTWWLYVALTPLLGVDYGYNEYLLGYQQHQQYEISWVCLNMSSAPNPCWLIIGVTCSTKCIADDHLSQSIMGILWTSKYSGTMLWLLNTAYMEIHPCYTWLS